MLNIQGCVAQPRTRSVGYAGYGLLSVLFIIIHQNKQRVFYVVEADVFRRRLRSSENLQRRTVNRTSACVRSAHGFLFIFHLDLHCFYYLLHLQIIDFHSLSYD